MIGCDSCGLEAIKLNQSSQVAENRTRGRNSKFKDRFLLLRERGRKIWNRVPLLVRRMSSRLMGLQQTIHGAGGMSRLACTAGSQT